MKKLAIRALLVTSLVSLTWFVLHSESDFPDYLLESLQILKKPIEDLLPDLQDEDNSQAILSASLDIDAYQELTNKRERWNEMRQRIETGRSMYDPLPSEIALSTSVVGRLAPDVPPPPGFTVQLPYESRLTVSGRKTIGMTYRSTRYTDSAFAQTQGVPTGQSNFELQQQLQVRINGQVGRKVTVNVDFDDTKEDKRDISIVYKGDPDELVQRAAFGDINLSLPQTEFAGYSKQVFGATAELKYKALRGYFIGSRTKGQTETKEFVGNVILQRTNIADTAYIRRRFYNYSLLNGGGGDKPIDVASMEVWLDTQDVSRSTASLTNFAADPSLLPSAVAYTGNFTKLIPGIDFTVDPSSGVITFRNVLAANAVVAINYTLPNGQRLTSRGSNGNPVILKYDETQVTQIPITEELTHYNIGAIKLVRDNGQGNFTLQLRDLNDSNIGPSKGIQYLPNNQGQILVDFEAGTFVLNRRLPSTEFDSVYLQSPTSKSRFFVEYRSRVKTYTLRPNIVINSERILMNGRVLIRDQDYFIDFESGFITFFNEDQITEATRITATYDFSPFGIAGEQSDTLVGARTELSLSPIAPIFASSLLGTTVIYDFAPKQTAAPDIRQTSGSFLVTEADANFKDLIFNPLPLLKSSFAGEVARSARNPNTFGKALIENMEGIKDDTSVSMNKLSWQIAANPTVAGRATYVDAIGVVNVANNASDNLTNELIPTLDINPGASALASDRTLVMNVRYDLTRSSEASIATVLAPTGIDFSKKLYIEMWVQGDGSVATSPTGTRMNVTMGQVSENFDASGVLKSEDANRNNSLDANEDVGISFVNPDNTIATLGSGNLRIDSNDLDRNGILDSANVSVGGNVGYAEASGGRHFRFTGSSAEDTVDHTGWQFVRVPLQISSETASSWSAIKTLRVAIKPNPSSTFGSQGVIRIAKISIVGNRWEAITPDVSGSTISVKAINNEDDAGYVSPAGHPDFDALNQINTALTGPTPTKRREQALALNYDFTAIAGTVTARSVTVSPMDFTVYGSVRFFVYKRSPPTVDTSGTNLIFRAGSDADYWEFSIPVSALPPNSWALVKINQGGGDRADRWESGSVNGVAGTIKRVGSPNLASVAQLQYGIINEATTSTTGEIWINELYADDVITRIGYASRLNADFEVMGWGTWGMGVRNIDRNFETFTSALSNQDRREENTYLTLSKLNWFPMKFTGLRRRTITPTINSVGNTTLVSILQEGRVQQNNYTAAGTLQVPNWPRVGLTYESDKVDSDNLFRIDKKDIYGATLDYTVPVKRRYLPENFQLGYKISKLNLDFESGALAGASDPFSVSDTRDDTRDISAKATFQPINGFTFTPNYTLSTTTEEKDIIYSTSSVDGSTETIKYDKARAQTAGLDGVLGLARWLSPRLRYTITTRETYGIPLLNNLRAADQKTVDRTSNSDVTWDFAWRDFSKKIRAFQSANIVTSYLLEDGDTWEKVDAGYGTLTKLSVRSDLGSGERRQQTLRDTLRSTMRWSPFDWANSWTGARLPLRTMSLTSTYTGTHQRTDTTGTISRINTRIFPDLIIGMSQTEHFFAASRFMSNSQMNLKHQLKTVDTVDRTFQRTTTWGGDWRFTILKKLDLFTTYTRTTDVTEDKINNVTSNDALNEALGFQLGFNFGKWRFSPKYDQSKQKAVDSSDRLTTDIRIKKPALQVYADLYLPAGLKLPFSDVIIFSNRIRTTNTVSMEQKRSSLNSLRDNTDTYTFATSNDYELTSLIRLQVGGSYSFTKNKQSAEANTYSYEFNSLLTIQF